jgi:hypothetical protein
MVARSSVFAHSDVSNLCSRKPLTILEQTGFPTPRQSYYIAEFFLFSFSSIHPRRPLSGHCQSFSTTSRLSIMSPGMTISSSNGKGKGLSPPSISFKPEKTAHNPLPDDSTFFGITPTTFDIREHLRLIGVLIFLSPLGLKFLTFQACAGIFVGSYVIPVIIRLKYPRFMDVSIVDDLRIEPGGSKGLIASITVVLLQVRF